MLFLFATADEPLKAASDRAFGVTFLSTPVIYGCLIPLLDYAYGVLALRCNEWENYAVDSTYFRHLIVKVFPFRFVNRCGAAACKARWCVFRVLTLTFFPSWSAPYSFIALYYHAFAAAAPASKSGGAAATNFDALGTHLVSFLVTGQLLNVGAALAYPYAVHRFRLWRAEAALRAQVFNRCPLHPDVARDAYFITSCLFPMWCPSRNVGGLEFSILSVAAPL